MLTNRMRLGMIVGISWLLISLTPGQVQAQEKSNKGTDFWLGFMAHVEGTNAGMSLYITSDSSTSGTVSVPGQGWSSNFTVTANSLTVVNIPSTVAYVGCSDCIVNRGVHITSLKNVIVYAHHYEGNKSDASLVLPTRTQGKEYYVMAYDQSSPGSTGRSEFMVVAHKDSTVIKITTEVDLLSNTGGIIPNGTTYTKVLDAGEVYQAQARFGTTAYDVTGTKIEVIDTGITANCRTVAVFSGSSYTQVGGCTAGWGINSGDNLLEQMYPINTWGKTFVLVPALGRVSDNFRFVGSVDNTQILVYKTVGTPDIIYVNEGEYQEIKDVSTVRAVIASQPIMVAQFQKTSKCDGNNIVGDPSMTILNPLEQTLTDITLYSSSYFDIDNHYINVVIPAHGAGTFRLDGSSVSFTPVPRFASLAYARIQVSAGNHRLKADVGFIATAYGEGDYESYGYAAGANVKDLIATINVANSPMTTELSNCLGTPTEFEGDAEYSVVRWEWDFGDGTGDTVQNPDHTYADTGSYLVRLYTYKPQYDGCSNYDSAFVTVNVYATPQAILYTENLCDSVMAFLADSSVVDAPEQNLGTKWTINGGTPQYGRTLKHLFDTTGLFEIEMVTITTHQCRDTFLDSITVSPNPVALFSVPNTCFYDSSAFMDLTTISSGAVTAWDWRFDDGDSSLIQTPKHLFADSGLHYITLTVTSDSGCFGTYTDSLYKYPRFDVSFAFNDTCFGMQNSFLNTTSLDGGVYTDTVWYTSENDTFTSWDISKTFASSGTHWVRLVMEQDSFCRDSFEQQIDIHALAQVDFSDAFRCFGDSTTFTDLSTYAGSYTRSWQLDDGYSSTDSVAKVVYASQGSKDVQLVITTDQGCQSSLSRTILLTRPQIQQLVLQDVCEGQSQQIAPQLSAGLDTFDSFQWLVNGTPVSTDSSFSYVFSPHGKRYVEVRIQTRNGCDLQRLDSVEVFDVPIADFIGAEVCANDMLKPLNNSSVEAPATIASYRWYRDGMLVSTMALPTLDPGNASAHQWRLVVTSDQGCKDTLDRSLNTHPVPVVNFGTSDQCLGDQTRFNDLSTIQSGGLVGFRWTTQGQNFTGNSMSYTYPAVGDYTVELWVRSDKACTDSLTRDIPIYPLPVLDVVLDPTAGCEPFELQPQNLSSIASGTISEYTWKWGNGNENKGFEPSYTYTVPGSYTVRLLGRSDKGCVDSITLSPAVIVYARPTADFFYDPSMVHVIITKVNLTNASSPDVIGWSWDVDGTVYSGPTASHHFPDAGDKRIVLEVTNGNGCTDQIEKWLFVNDSLFVYIPDAFTPNGDGINDLFGLAGVTTAVRDLHMQVYNRWGELIFESFDPGVRWDGRYKGALVQEGNYLVKFRYTDQKRSKWHFHSQFVTVLIPES